MRMIVEQLAEWRLAGETEVLGGNLPQRYFVHHKFHMTSPGLEPRTAAVGSQRLTAWAMARPLLADLGIDIRTALKWILKQCALNSCGSGQGLWAGACEHGNKPSGSMIDDVLASITFSRAMIMKLVSQSVSQSVSYVLSCCLMISVGV
jgi:hypothetical protein